MEAAAQIALNAVIAASIYSLIALGFNLLYSTTRFFDLSYGAVAALGGYIVYYLYNIHAMPLLVSLPIGILGAGLAGYLVEKVVYRRLRAHKASSSVLLIASLGVLLVIQSLLAILFSSQFHLLTRDLSADSVLHIAGAAITDVQLAIIGAALLISLPLSLVMAYTKLGLAVRAIAEDEEVASIVGVNTERMIGIVYLIGAAIGGTAGIATGFDTGIIPTMGLALLLKGIIASVIGGVGNVYGGVLGAVLLAVVENIGAWYFPGEWRDTIAFVVLIAFLLLRPKGIFAK